MSAKDSPTRFVVFFNELPRFWSDTREGAEELRRDGWRLMYDPGESRDVDPVKLLDPDTCYIKEFEKSHAFHCEMPHGEEVHLIFEDDGWVGCPECRRWRIGFY